MLLEQDELIDAVAGHNAELAGNIVSHWASSDSSYELHAHVPLAFKQA